MSNTLEVMQSLFIHGIRLIEQKDCRKCPTPRNPNKFYYIPRFKNTEFNLDGEDVIVVSLRAGKKADSLTHYIIPYDKIKIKTRPNNGNGFVSLCPSIFLNQCNDKKCDKSHLVKINLSKRELDEDDPISDSDEEIQPVGPKAAKDVSDLPPSPNTYKKIAGNNDSLNWFPREAIRKSLSDDSTLNQPNSVILPAFGVGNGISNPFSFFPAQGLEPGRPSLIPIQIPSEPPQSSSVPSQFSSTPPQPSFSFPESRYKPLPTIQFSRKPLFSSVMSSSDAAKAAQTAWENSAVQFKYLMKYEDLAFTSQKLEMSKELLMEIISKALKYLLSVPLNSDEENEVKRYCYEILNRAINLRENDYIVIHNSIIKKLTSINASIPLTTYVGYLHL